MKHSVTILLISGLFAWVFMGCKNEVISTDPTHDTTKLWPAFDNTTEKWGYINEKGKMVIPAQYDEVHGFSCGYACVHKDGQIHYIDPSGAIQASMEGNEDFYYFYNLGYDFHYDYVVVKKDDKYGLMNKKFEYVVQPSYLEVGNMSSSGLAVVRDYRKNADQGTTASGYINTKGEIAIPCRYDYALPFVDGYAIVMGDTRHDCGVINTSGEYVINPGEYYLSYVGGEMFAFQKNNSYGCGLLNSKGEILSDPAANVEYEPAVDNELIGVSNTQEKFGYMDFSRNMKIDYQFDYVMPFYEGYAFVEVEEGDEDIVKVIDTKGKVVYTLPLWSEPETGFHNGLALIVVETDDDYRYRYITPQGETVYEWKEPDIDIPCSPVRKLSERYTMAGTEQALHASETGRMNSMEEFTAQTKHFSSARHERRHKHACDPGID